MYSFLQEDDPDALHLIASFLLFDGRQNERTFHVMKEEGLFARLLELIQAQKEAEEEDYAAAVVAENNNDDRRSGIPGGPGFLRLMMNLLYEMARIQRLKIEDLGECSLS